MATKLSDFLEYTVTSPYEFTGDVTFTKGVREEVETLSAIVKHENNRTSAIKQFCIASIISL